MVAVVAVAADAVLAPVTVGTRLKIAPWQLLSESPILSFPTGPVVELWTVRVSVPPLAAMTFVSPDVEVAPRYESCCCAAVVQPAIAAAGELASTGTPLASDGRDSAV